MNIIDRIARPMWGEWKSFWPTPTDERGEPMDQTWEGLSPEAHDVFRKMARAAIHAMREPTPVMVEWGDEAIVGVLNNHPHDPKMTDGTPAEKCWPAMIDAALKESP